MSGVVMLVCYDSVAKLIDLLVKPLSSLTTRLSIYIPAYLPSCLPNGLSVYLSVYLSAYLLSMYQCRRYALLLCRRKSFN